MKGIKKCFGLFLVLAITLGLSLSVSSDTNALKHDYESLRIFSPMYYTDAIGTGYGLAPNFYSRYPIDNPLSEPHFYGMPINNELQWYYRTYNNQTQSCNTYEDSHTSTFYTSNMRRSSGSNYYSWYNWYSYPVGVAQTYGNVVCNPYPGTWYDYDSIYLYGVSERYGIGRYSTIKDVFGLYYDSLAFPQYRDVNYMYSFGFPMAYDESVVGILTPGREIEFQFSLSSETPFYTSDKDGNLSEFDISNLGVTFQIGAYDEDNSQYSQGNRLFYTSISKSGVSPSGSTWFSNCNLIQQQSQPSDATVTQLIFTCKFTSPTTLSHVTPYISFSYYDPDMSSSIRYITPIWYNPGDVYFGATYLVTDNDRTPGAPASFPVTGRDPTRAPGWSSTIGFGAGDSADGFFSSLTNLFNFSFLNPFAPMFALFTDNSQCANIPIIAGMLHSEETTYCPWFSANTRNTLTPVLGIVSTMLLFGFLVRWLGASSGNMFEDSGHIESPGWGRTGDTLSPHGWRVKK